MAVNGGSVGEELRALRQVRGLSQKDLAEAVGISAAQVSQMETGRYHPSLVMLNRMLDVLDAHIVFELNEGGTFDAERRLPSNEGGPRETT